MSPLSASSDSSGYPAEGCSGAVKTAAGASRHQSSQSAKYRFPAPNLEAEVLVRLNAQHYRDEQISIYSCTNNQTKPNGQIVILQWLAASHMAYG